MQPWIHLVPSTVRERMLVERRRQRHLQRVALSRLRSAWRVAAALVGLGVSAAPHAAHACATVSPGDAVGITREEAIVVWDAASHTERFIRRADFTTTAKDFGFLVPTPARPTLAEASDAAFAALDATIEREREKVTRNEWSGGCLLLALLGRSKSAAIPASAVPEVRLLETATVAGLDAAVLEADSATALVSWLNAHGYVQRPEIAAWLEPYVKSRWTITAFKYAEAEGRPSGELLSKAVMLTFRAERPFFPYREPTDAPARWGRILRVFLLSTERMEGSLGDAGAAWPAETVFAAPLAGRDDLVTREVPRALLPAGAWLTALNDRSPSRPSGGDLFFAPAADHAPVRPPPIVTTRRMYVPLEGVLILLVAGALVFRSIRRARRG